MKTNGCLRFAGFFVLLLFFTVHSQAQPGDRNIQSEKRTKDGRIRFLKFRTPQNGASRIDTSVLNIKRLLSLGNKYALVRDSRSDLADDRLKSSGGRHARFTQSFNGIKVEFALVNAVSKNGSLNSITGEYFQVPDNFQTTPSLPEQAAFQRALTHIGAKKYSWEDPAFSGSVPKGRPKGELLICKDFSYSNAYDSLPRLRLAYKFGIYAIDPLRYDNIYVDAIDGKILLVDPIIKHVDGSAATRYSGTRTISTTINPSGNYILKDSGNTYRIATYNLNKGTNYSAVTDFSDADNNWTAGEYNNANWDNAALDAHWGAMMTMDYWRTVHNRNSYDNNGGMIRSYVHYSIQYVNAFWDGLVMTYGDGNGTTNFPLTTVDICGHEIGHAVCQYTANLIYSGESGALNESFSDIWGACIKRFAAPEKNTWLMGDEITTNGSAFRSFINPNQYGQPDTYKGTYWYDDADVHTNSGVQNHWFYILTEGESGTNDLGFAFNVTGIGITKAAQIAYRAESVYLFPSATYNDARNASLQAAEDLFGDNSSEVIQTAEAWNAVGVYEQLPVPLNLTANLTLDSKINLSWSLAQGDIAGFLVERSITAGAFSAIANLGASLRSFEDTNVINDAVIRYRVRSYQTNGLYSNYSGTAEVRVGNAPYIMQNGTVSTCGVTFLDPGGISNYPAAQVVTTFQPSVAGNKIRVSFSKFKTNPSDYLAVYNGPSTFQSFIGVFEGSTLPPTISSTAPNGELTFKFSASSPTTDSGWVASIICFKPLTPPSNLSASVSSKKFVTLSWSDNTNEETGYLVERSISDSLHFSTVASLLANATGYVDTTNVNAQVYYRVSPLKDAVPGGYSNIVSTIVGNVFVMQNAIVNDCGILFLDPGGFGNYPNSVIYTTTFKPAESGKKIKVAFSQFLLENCCDYLFIYNGPSSAYPLLGQFKSNNIPPSFESTAPNGELTFVFNSDAYGLGYPGWQAYISCVRPVAKPTNLTTVVGSDNIRLNWTDNANDEELYVIEKSVDAPSRYDVLAQLPANSTSYTDASVTSNSLNFYRIRAKRDSVFSPSSDTAKIGFGNAPFLMKDSLVISCDKLFMDQGGTDVIPAAYFIATATFKPSAAASRIRIAFNKFKISSAKLDVFNGSTVNSQLIGTYSGNSIPSYFDGANPDGSLTFRFSNNGYTDTGWVANVYCISSYVPPTGFFVYKVNGNTTSMAWTPPNASETGFMIERSCGDSLHFKKLDSVNAAIQQWYTDSSALNNVMNYYRVRSLYGGISSPPTKAIGITTLTCGGITTISPDTAVANVLVSGLTNLVDNECRLYAAVEPQGENPVSGTLKSSLWVDGYLASAFGLNFVRRHFDIHPDSNYDQATGVVHMYFNQSEFDEYNSGTNHAKLPANVGDSAGINNMRVFACRGINLNRNGSPGSYPNLPEELDPSNVQIVWNTNYNCWEVMANVTGFGGFFISSKNDTTYQCTNSDNDFSTTLFKSNINGTNYRWQKFNGSAFVDLSDNANYSGTATHLLQVKTSSMVNGDKFRCVVNGANSRTFVMVKGNRWNGTVNNDWFNPQNWSCGTVPGANADVLVEPGKENYPIINTDISVRSLTIYSGARVDVAAGVKVNVLR